MSRRYKVEEKEFSEINITPFTDVILVLLLIFMITSPFILTSSFHVKLPRAINSDGAIDKSIKVSLDEQYKIHLNNQTISITDLPNLLLNEYTLKNNRTVVIEADENIVYGSFVQLIDAVKKTNPDKLLIATKREKGESFIK